MAAQKPRPGKQKANPGPLIFHRRSLGARDIGAHGVTRLIDCVATEDDKLRCFFGAGTPASAFQTLARLGCAVPLLAIELSGATMLTLRDTGPVALADGATLAVDPEPAETALFRDRNVILSSRIDETAAQVAEGLAYHHRRFSANAALILNRAPDDDGRFAADLAKALAALPLMVVLLDSPLPLGRPGEVALSHLYEAPAAPGRARMERPEPDPWRSALGEPLLYEITKWRFLSEARAVLSLDVCDVLAPDAPNPFDLCRDTEAGAIALNGQMAYPWRVKAGQEARFGDHICRQFETGRGLARWGVAPRKAGLNRAWRMIRIADTKVDALPVVPFFRAMALRVPHHSTAKLVPKTSIIEDDRLLRLATEHFHHAPARVPISELKSLEQKPAEHLRTTIVSTMKNEGPFLLEWVAYHRAIGVNDFVVFTNDCTDGTDTFLQLLQDKGFLQHRPNPWRPGDPITPHFTALQSAETEPVVLAADWLICMDADEFINVKIGDGTMQSLYAAMGDANMISLTWRLIGDSGVVSYQDKPIIAQFDRCAPEVIRKPHQAWGFKTLFRNTEIFRKFGIHRPKGLKPEHWDQIRWLNGSGKPMPQSMLRNGWRSSMSTYGYDWVQMNHYAVRSVETFLVKRDRGRANHSDRDLGRNYWFRMSHNQDRDTSIQRMLPRFQAELDRMLSDPDIAAAHQYSVDKHRAKIAELMTRPEQQAFFAELTGERMTRLCKMQQHFGSAVFSAGPHVIPDEIALNPDLPADFFFTVEHIGEANH